MQNKGRRFITHSPSFPPGSNAGQGHHEPGVWRIDDWPAGDHGVHYIHGRAVPLASGISLARPDLHVFLFGGDGDGFSIGGNHVDHGARKNINMTYFIMDNFVYGLTKKQTSPRRPSGSKARPILPARSINRSTR